VSFASIYTNRVPVTPYRGAGQPQAVFALERVMDLIARETGRDRAAVRFANFVQSADMPYDTGLPNYRGFGNVIYDSGDYPAVLRRALEMSNCLRARQEGRLLGVGLACYVELTGVGPFEGAAATAWPWRRARFGRSACGSRRRRWGSRRTRYGSMARPSRFGVPPRVLSH
jgi:aerobic carbon-monoxide dehydrogenase large subunit